MFRVTRAWQRWRDRYLAKHLPASTQVDLKQHQLFVFPTPLGAMWLGLVLLCYLLGTNYQNNLVLLLSYWLLSVWIVCIVLAFRNLHRLQLKSLPLVEGFVSEYHAWCIELSRPAIALYARTDGSTIQARAQHQQLHLQLNAAQRSARALPRIKIWSDYPLGLIRCWSYPQLAGQQLVYPAPLLMAGFRAASANNAGSNDTVDGVREYRKGDQIQRLDWGRLARQQQLVVKTFAADTQADVQTLEATTCHEALASHFAAIVVEAQQTQQMLELKLPHAQLAADNSPTHYRHILRALATWS